MQILCLLLGFHLTAQAAPSKLEAREDLLASERRSWKSENQALRDKERAEIEKTAAGKATAEDKKIAIDAIIRKHGQQRIERRLRMNQETRKRLLQNGNKEPR